MEARATIERLELRCSEALKDGNYSLYRELAEQLRFIRKEKVKAA